MKATILIFVIALILHLPNFAQINEKSETLYPVFVNGKYGYVNSHGEIVIKPQFDKANKFQNGLGLVTIEAKNISDTPGHYDYIMGKQGYVDKTGKFVIPPGKYYLAEDFSEGLAGVGVNDCKKDYCYGYIDTTGKVVIEPQFQTVGEFHEGTADVRMPNDKWGVIDKTGKFIIPPIYDGVFPFFESVGIALIDSNPKNLKLSEMKVSKVQSLFFDKKGRIIARVPFLVFGVFGEGLVTFITEKGMGFVDKTGKIVIEPIFRSAFRFSEGLCPARIEKKWGYIDKTGKFIIEPIYDQAFEFSNGLARVMLNGKTGFVDKTGKFIIQPQAWDISNFENELAFFRNGYISGYLDKSGEVVWQNKDK